MGDMVLLTNWPYLTPRQPSGQYLVWVSGVQNGAPNHTPFGLFPVQKAAIGFHVLFCDMLDREIAHKATGLFHHLLCLL